MSITEEKITVEIFLQCFGVYLNIVILVFPMILGGVEQKNESKNQHLTSDWVKANNANF